jgi:hypothetical protein
MHKLIVENSHDISRPKQLRFASAIERFGVDSYIAREVESLQLER